MLSERTIESAPHRWRVLMGGSGPPLLFLHGAGASADSFRPLSEYLVDRFQMIAPDLPGHGGTRLGAPRRSSLSAMAEDLTTMVKKLGRVPLMTVGHSAGCALALATDRTLSPRGHILMNAALQEFDGLAGLLLPTLAKGLAATPFSADIVAAKLTQDRIERLLERTGSRTNQEMVERYARLASNPSHVSGTLRMMAEWDLTPLLRKLSLISTQTLLIVGKRDTIVLPTVSNSAIERLRNARLKEFDGGHLLHEENPHAIATEILAFYSDLA